MHQSLSYRSHIDGLRAIAVLGVVLFHFGADWLPGGFIGVDVFFVISGFLISRSIFGDMADGSFSIVGFYERRIRRIAPAFLVVTAVTALAASLILLPHELLIFGRSMLWSVFAAGNIFFYQRLDYFGPGAQEMPLLHYWSLGVEEQFYLVLPALLLLCRRYRPGAVPAMIVALLLASLVASEAMLRHDPAAAYFLLPFRAFEMLIGSALALPGMRFPASAPLRAGAVLAGCVLILGGMVFITSAMPFPGLLALVPSLGAALVIWGGEKGASLPSRLLSIPPMLFFGRISYSLYLVHWPIVSLVSERFDDLDPTWFLIGGVLASTLLGYLSYRFVEQPVRLNRALFTRARLAGGTAAATALLAVFAQVTVSTRGLPMRYEGEVLRLAKFATYKSDHIFRSGSCFIVFSRRDTDLKPECLPTQRPNIILWGNSHIAQFVNAIDDVAKQHGYALGQVTGAACTPFAGGQGGGSPFCASMNQLALDWLMKNRPDIVVIGAVSAIFPEFDRGVAELAKAGIRVVVVGPVPLFRRTVPKILARRIARGDTDIMAGRDLKPEVAQEDAALKAHFAGNPDVTYLSVLDTGCHGTDCPLSANGEPLQFDASHFTQAGVDFFGFPLARRIFADAGVAVGASATPVSSAP
ncbi:acyltransferase family protein [Ancylobacter sp. G4_0304]|uniref:acyltransferase family protein n=1 Tax=Ancylobacter sp. G4_0304 TaxID=3114289 RepID=UPI0039C625EA